MCRTRNSGPPNPPTCTRPRWNSATARTRPSIASRPISASAPSPGENTAMSRSNASSSTASRCTSAPPSTNRSTRRGCTRPPTMRSSSGTWRSPGRWGSTGSGSTSSPTSLGGSTGPTARGSSSSRTCPTPGRRIPGRAGPGSRPCGRRSPATSITRRSSPGSPSMRPGDWARRRITRRIPTPSDGSARWSRPSGPSTRRGWSRTTPRATTTTSSTRTSIAGISTSTITPRRGNTSRTSSIGRRRAARSTTAPD